MVDKLGNGFVTVVSGLPRSGTSMMMQMLAAGGMPVLADANRPADADNPRGYYEFEPVKRTRQESGWVAGAAGKAVKVIHLMLPDLPGGYEYRVLFMQRDLTEVLASQEVMLRHLGRRGAELTPERLAEVFEQQLARVKDWVGRQPNVAALEVNYRQVIADPAGQASRANRFLGGALDEAGMVAAVDASLYRQRGDGGPASSGGGAG